MPIEEVLYYLNTLIREGEEFGIVECSSDATDDCVKALKQAVEIIKELRK